MNRRSFLVASAVAPLATPALATDDTQQLQSALDRGGIIHLDRDYSVTSLRVTKAGTRIVSPGHCSLSGPKIRVEREFHVAAHGVVIEGVGFEGGTFLAKRSPMGWGDLDLNLTDCTFYSSPIQFIGRGLFLRGCWFNSTKTFVTIDFPSQSELAPPQEPWQTVEGGARKVHIDGCYFHHGSFASVLNLSPDMRGIQVTGCHHDGPQALFRGYLNGGTISGCSAYRLRGPGVSLLKSRASTITGNVFAGSPYGSMKAAVELQDCQKILLTGNVRDLAKGKAVVGRGYIEGVNSW